MTKHQNIIDSDTQLTASTCQHPKYPISNIIDGNSQTFWVTTGMFPQEFTLNLAKKAAISKITILSRKVTEWIVYAKKDDDSFELMGGQGNVVADSVMDDLEKLQNCSIVNNVETSAVKFVIANGYDSYASVHDITVN